MTMPEKIFVPVGNDTATGSWCADRISSADVEYVRADLHLKAVEALTAENAELFEAACKLNALENAGVDNWEGYDYAMEALREEDA